MDFPESEGRQEREKFLDNWYKNEKSARRIGAVILFFTTALIVALDQPADQYTLVAVVSSIAGSITLLLYSRRPREDRTGLHFLQASTQSNRSMIFAMGAAMLLMLFGSRPLAIITAVVFLMLAGWYRWRSKKVQDFDRLLRANRSEKEGEGSL